MRFPSSSVLMILIIVSAVLGGSISIVSNVYVANPGMYLKFKLYNFANNTVIDDTSLFSNGNVVLQVEVSAIVPPIYNGDLKVIYKGVFQGSNTIFIPAEKLLKIARGWVETYKARRGDQDKTYSGLIIRAFIYNKKTGEILYQLYDSITYKPVDIINRKTMKYTIHLAKHSLTALKIDTSYITAMTAERIAREVKLDQLPFPVFIRIPVFEIKPENITSELPSDYFKNVGGKLYVKTPVLIAWNKLSYSGSVGVSINIGVQKGEIGVYPTFTTGEILSKISNGVAPNVNLWKGSGFTWGGETYYYYVEKELAPNQQWWAWIWARPIYKVYNVYLCDSNFLYCEYFGDDVENVITDILTYGSNIEGGSDLGLPDENLMEKFYEGTNETLLQIPDTYLDDGKLDPGEYVSFPQIFNYYDECGSDFEIGIPAGSIAALGICSALGLPTGGMGCAVAVAFASTFQTSISAQGPQVFIYGGIYNHGDDPNIPGDYDIYEYVYMRISKYQYKQDPPWWCFWCGPCYYDVPAGIYFEFI